MSVRHVHAPSVDKVTQTDLNNREWKSLQKLTDNNSVSSNKSIQSSPSVQSWRSALALEKIDPTRCMAREGARRRDPKSTQNSGLMSSF